MMLTRQNLPPPPPAATPEVYMTPQLEKEKRGLYPSLYEPGEAPVKKSEDHLRRSYQTNSKLLQQIKCDGDDREKAELDAILNAIQYALKRAVTSKAEALVHDVVFRSEGCIWKIELDHKLNGADLYYRMEIVCMTNRVDVSCRSYIIESTLITKMEPDILSRTPRCFKDAKQAFDKISCAVRKAVVRLEFPSFPEGLKGRFFRDVYQLNTRIKSGSYATVCRGTNRETGNAVAVKCVLRNDLNPTDDAAVYDEVAILSSLQHPHIVPILDFFAEKDCYFIVMELMRGGDLFDRIGKKKSYSEADARDLIVKMLKAVSICHQHSIAHCDMKPKNLLLVSEVDDSYIKIADFGFAARVHEPKSLTKQCGTPFFVAPEILTQRPYDQQVDMWSVGCIIFLLLSGSLPFKGRSQKDLFQNIIAGKYEFNSEVWEGVSEDAIDLVKNLLVVNPDKRYTAKKALLHPWIKVETCRLSKNGLLSTSQRLKTFNAKMKLRSAVIVVDIVSTLRRASNLSPPKPLESNALITTTNSRANTKPRPPRRSSVA